MERRTERSVEIVSTSEVGKRPIELDKLGSVLAESKRSFTE